MNEKEKGGDIMIKKRYVIIPLLAFCLTATLFIAAATSGKKENPWDIISELQSKVDSLNASLIELEERVSALEGSEPELVGYWKLDEGSGITAYDTSDYGNDGTLVNGPSWVDGKYGKALSFDGIDDYVNIPDSPSLRVQSFTLEAWIYMTHRPYQHGTRHSAIINKLHYQGSSGTKGYKLQFEAPTSDNDHLVISLGDSVTQRFLIDYNSNNDLTLHEWHHIIGTYNGTIANLYIDGELKSSSTPVTYAIVHDDAPLAIGYEITSGAKDVRFKGLIDNVMVYNRALSAEEIQSLYQP